MASATKPESARGASFNFPFAASPDIIRANQKDAYFQGVLLEHLSSVIRRVKGARYLHSHGNEASALADALYLGLTTLIGNRTLGEEYCDIVQVEGVSLRQPSLTLRAGYILSSILVPYGFNRILPLVRCQLRQRLEASLRRKGVVDGKKATSYSAATQQYLLQHVDALTSPAPVYAVSLATFYFTSAYYHLSKRLLNLRYIFTRKVDPSDQRAGYEVLGVLLVLQLTVQAYLHLHALTTSVSSNEPSSVPSEGAIDVSLDPLAYSRNNALLFDAGATSAHPNPRLLRTTHTPAAETPRVDLADDAVMAWMNNKQARKCTLCLEPMKDPSALTCGHMFCWTCICDWCREKPECPLCRQGCLVQHVLPIRG